MPLAKTGSSEKKFGSFGFVMKTPGCAPNCAAMVLVPHFIAPRMMKSGRVSCDLAVTAIPQRRQDIDPDIAGLLCGGGWDGLADQTPQLRDATAQMPHEIGHQQARTAMHLVKHAGSGGIVIGRQALAGGLRRLDRPASATEMHRASLGRQADAPTGLTRAPRIFDILEIEKIAFVHRADLSDHLIAQKDACETGPLDL